MLKQANGFAASGGSAGAHLPGTTRTSGAGETIMARIAAAYPTLSRAHRKAADFVLKHPFQAATMMIDELARAAGISAATANRFARALGIDGYPAFRAGLVHSFSATLAPVEKLRAELQRSATSAEITRAALDQSVRNLQTTVRQLAAANIDLAATKILAANRVFTVGFGMSGMLANFAAHALSPYCRVAQNAAAEGGAEQAVRRLLKVDSGDVVIGIALPRYSQDTIDLLRFACGRGATVMAITDGPASPVAKGANFLFCVGAEHHVLTSSGVAAFAFIEAISAAVARQTKDPLDAAAEFSERVLPYLYVGTIDEAPPATIRRPAARKAPVSPSAPTNKGRDR